MCVCVDGCLSRLCSPYKCMQTRAKTVITRVLRQQPSHAHYSCKSETMRLCVAFAIVVACASVPALACTSGNSFDFITLVQQYAPVDCPYNAKINCNGTNDAFATIHGFWPSIGNDGPCTCSSEKFSPNVISSLMPDMQKYWPSYQQSDDTFWAHEYEKHGTCASSITRLSTQFDFFETTLQLTKQYNAIPMLAKGGGIKPSDSTRYNTADAQTAIKKAFGGIPAFTCKSSKLDSVYLCFSKSLQPMDCPGLKNTCGSSFLIPASRQAEREDEGIAQA